MYVAYSRSDVSLKTTANKPINETKEAHKMSLKKSAFIDGFFCFAYNNKT